MDALHGSDLVGRGTGREESRAQTERRVPGVPGQDHVMNELQFIILVVVSMIGALIALETLKY